MGGPGSGRPRSYNARTTVEDCRELDVSGFVRRDHFRHASGNVTWYRGDEVTATIGYTVRQGGGSAPSLVLRYAVTPRGGERLEVEESVQLVSTPCHFGGRRWWFTCPLSVDGRPCGRRVRKLYLPPAGRYFGCRHCYALTYRSVQEAHKHDATFRRIAERLGDGTTAAEVRAALGGRRR